MGGLPGPANKKPSDYMLPPRAATALTNQTGLFPSFSTSLPYSNQAFNEERLHFLQPFGQCWAFCAIYEAPFLLSRTFEDRVYEEGEGTEVVPCATTSRFLFFVPDWMDMGGKTKGKWSGVIIYIGSQYFVHKMHG